MSKRCELQKEYYQAKGNYKGNGKYCDKYVSWLEEQILALRIHAVSWQSEQLNCDHEWIVDTFDCFGFPAFKYCDKCCKREAV